MTKTRAVKIGRSSKVDRRLKELQTSCPYPLQVLLVLAGEGHREKSLHALLAAHRIRTQKGEWFSSDCLPDLPDDIYGQFPESVLEST